MLVQHVLHAASVIINCARAQVWPLFCARFQVIAHARHRRAVPVPAVASSRQQVLRGARMPYVGYPVYQTYWYSAAQLHTYSMKAQGWHHAWQSAASHTGLTARILFFVADCRIRDFSNTLCTGTLHSIDVLGRTRTQYYVVQFGSSNVAWCTVRYVLCTHRIAKPTSFQLSPTGSTLHINRFWHIFSWSLLFRACLHLEWQREFALRLVSRCIWLCGGWATRCPASSPWFLVLTALQII